MKDAGAHTERDTLPPAKSMAAYHFTHSLAISLIYSLRYSVMGWSDGAMSAVLLAAANPASTNRLVIFGGNAYLTPDDVEVRKSVECQSSGAVRRPTN